MADKVSPDKGFSLNIPPIVAPPIQPVNNDPEKDIGIASVPLPPVHPVDNQPDSEFTIPLAELQESPLSEDEPDTTLKMPVIEVHPIQPVDNEKPAEISLPLIQVPSIQPVENEKTVGIAIPVVTAAPVQPVENEKPGGLTVPAVTVPSIQPVDNEPKKKTVIPLSGKLITAEDPLAVGKNFRTLTNMRYKDKWPVTIPGMTKINSQYDLDTYLKVRSTHHFRKIQPAEATSIETHVLAQAWNTGFTAATVIQNTTEPPGVGNFVGSGASTPATALWPDSAGAGVGRFSDAPGGKVAYCNGDDTCLWGGNGIPVTGFITSTAAVTDTPTNPMDYTDAMQNTRQDSENVAIIGGILGATTRILLDFESKDGLNIADMSPASGGNGANDASLAGAADWSTEWAKFGLKSGKISASEDAFSIADSDDLDWGTGNGTIEFWEKGVAIWAPTPEITCTYASGTGKITRSAGALFNGCAPGDLIAGIANDTSFRFGQIISKDAGDQWIEVAGSFVDGDSFTAITLCDALCGRYADATNYWYIGLSANYAMLVRAAGGAPTFTYVSLPSTISDTNHISIVQVYGVSLKFYVNGVGVTFGNVNLQDLNAAPLTFGRCRWAAALYADSSQGWVDVYFDEILFDKGTALRTTTFSPPTKSYAAAALTWIVRSPLPIQGGKIYIPTGQGNVTTSTLTLKEWNGYSWVSVAITDNTAAGGIALSATGTFICTTPTTTDSSKPQIIEGGFGYWYQFALSAGEAKIYYMTLDAAFQQIQDIPDGIDRPVAAFFKYTTVYTDYTLNVQSDVYDTADPATYASLSSLAAFNSGTGANCVILGFFERQAGFNIGVPSDKVNAVAGTLAVDYWGGSGYVEVAHAVDGSAEAGAPIAKPGTISFTIPDPWNVSKHTVSNNALPLYYYRIRSTGALTAATAIYYVAGIAAPVQVRGYKFPLYSQDCLMLCCNMDGKRNSVLISSPGTSQVFNGTGSQEITFGNDEELNCGCTLFSQYGSNLFNLTVLFKDKEIWNLVNNGTSWIKYRVSETIGCPAGLTLDTVIIPPIEGQQQANRNMALWVNAGGVYASEGRHPILVSRDIRDLFDQNAVTHINLSYLKSFSGKVDQARLEYHVFLALTTGSVTTLDDEWVLDLRQWKWSHVDRGTGKKIQCAVDVTDAYGGNHLYGFIDTGYMERLENGTDFDGNPIVSTWQLGDYPLIDGDFLTETKVVVFVPVLAAKLATTADAYLIDYINTTDELKGDGTFTGAATNWTLASGWTYSANTVIKNAGGTSALSHGTFAPVIGNKSRLTYTISNWTAGTTLTPTLGGASGAAISANGTYTDDLTATTTAGLAFTPTDNVRCTIDNVTIDTVYNIDPTHAGYRLAFPVKVTNGTPGIVHSLKMTITTNDENNGLEAMAVGIFYTPVREHDYT